MVIFTSRSYSGGCKKFRHGKSRFSIVVEKMGSSTNKIMDQIGGKRQNVFRVSYDHVTKPSLVDKT